MNQSELQKDGIKDEKLRVPCHMRNEMGNTLAGDRNTRKMGVLTSKIWNSITWQEEQTDFVASESRTSANRGTW